MLPKQLAIRADSVELVMNDCEICRAVVTGLKLSGCIFRYACPPAYFASVRDSENFRTSTNQKKVAARCPRGPVYYRKSCPDIETTFDLALQVEYGNLTRV